MASNREAGRSLCRSMQLSFKAAQFCLTCQISLIQNLTFYSSLDEYPRGCLVDMIEMDDDGIKQRGRQGDSGGASEGS
jgi:hypothetical protein